ncbi:MAG: YchJ family metal-binding protein [Formivibrio sp.]|nr:YchJ family metal-binding protein [Formivibrio sp.]
MKKKKTGNVLAVECPCGSGHCLAACCGLYHDGVSAPSAEKLMRSRYSAYVLGLEGYLLATWHASTRPAVLDLAADAQLRWLGLEVLSKVESSDSAEVRFVARFKVNGRAGRMEEASRFVRENGCWYYVDGDVRS